MFRSCTQETDRARGIPCPACSGPFRAPDKLLTPELALPEQHLGDSIGAGSSSSPDGGEAATSTAAADGGAAAAGGCGYLYCDMAQLLGGEAQPWTCDACGGRFADDTEQLWGRCAGLAGVLAGCGRA